MKKTTKVEFKLDVHLTKALIPVDDSPLESEVAWKAECHALGKSALGRTEEAAIDNLKLVISDPFDPRKMEKCKPGSVISEEKK